MVVAGLTETMSLWEGDSGWEGLGGMDRNEKETVYELGSVDLDI